MKKQNKQLKDKKVVTLKEMQLKQVKGGAAFCTTPWD